MWNTPIRTAAAATTSGMEVKGASNRQSDGRERPGALGDTPASIRARSAE
jgi:hypothetical protein